MREARRLRERRRERGLAAAAEPAADEQRRALRPPGVTLRQGEVLPGARGRGDAFGRLDLRLGGLEPLDRSAHAGPVRTVEGEQRT